MIHCPYPVPKLLGCCLQGVGSRSSKELIEFSNDGLDVANLSSPRARVRAPNVIESVGPQCRLAWPSGQRERLICSQAPRVEASPNVRHRPR